MVLDNMNADFVKKAETGANAPPIGVAAPGAMP